MDDKEQCDNLKFDWYHKSLNRLNHIFGKISKLHISTSSFSKRGMVNKVLLLSHPKFHQKNLKRIINILQDNDYPLNFIFDTMNSRFKALLNKWIYKQSNTNATGNNKISVLGSQFRMS